MNADPLEILWDGLLSRDPKRILATYSGLDPESQQVVIEHLLRMTREDGWHPEQIQSAQTALDTLNSEHSNTD